MNKTFKIVFSISIIINLILIYVLTCKIEVKEFDSSEYINKIDSLELIINQTNLERDSIKKEIDTIFIKIDNNKKDYEEVRNNIINNSISEDYLFFTKYLESNKERFDSINNINSTKIY